MRTFLTLLAVAGVFGGVVFGGSQLVGGGEPVPAATLAGEATQTTATTTTGPGSGSTVERRLKRTAGLGTAALARDWSRSANAACVQSISETKAQTARLRDAKTIDDMIAVARLELANERGTIEEVASRERLHPNRAVAQQLTLVGRKYVHESERVLDLVGRRQLLDAIDAGMMADTLRAQWGALAGSLGATKCGSRNNDLLVGLALDRIGP